MKRLAICLLLLCSAVPAAYSQYTRNMYEMENPAIIKARLSQIRDLRKKPGIINPDTLLKLYRIVSVINLRDIIGKDSASQYTATFLKLALQQKNNDYVAQAYFRLGSEALLPEGKPGAWASLDQTKINYEQSLIYTLKALDVCLLVTPGGCEALHAITVNLSGAYFGMNQPERVIEVINRVREKQPKGSSFVYLLETLAEAYTKTGQYQKAIDTYWQCSRIEVFTLNGKPTKKSEYPNLARNYNLLNQPDKALETIALATKDTAQLPERQRIITRLRLGEITVKAYFLKKDYQKVVDIGETVYIPRTNRQPATENSVDLPKMLYESYKQLGIPARAMHYMERYLTERDTLTNQTNRENLLLKLAEIERKYNYDKIKLEAERNKAIQEAELAQAEQTKALQQVKMVELEQYNSTVEAEKTTILQRTALLEITRKNEAERLTAQNKQTELRRKLETQRLQQLNEQTRLLSSQRNRFLLSLLGIFAVISITFGTYRHVAQQKALRLKDAEQWKQATEFKEKEASFVLKLSQTEMAALRSQMNPHFIFNCLNSIQFFTAQNDAERASDYLTKFSRLIRLVLENSKSEKVTLANELETLRLYIEMEAMRFQQKVRYEIQIHDNIDTESVEIPPLLLQPFVENAIWHGLMHKEDGGTVTVSAQQPRPDYLRVQITDDGVGRQKAAEYKSKSATKNKSLGMKLTADRIELINQLYQTQTHITVEDLTDADGQPTGTQVVVEIPI
jgi:Histidine kinase